MFTTMRPLILALSLLSPAFSDAASWEILPSMCVPDADTLANLKVETHYVTLRRDAIDRRAVTLRCPIHSLQGTVTKLEVELYDPDGPALGRWVQVDLKRQRDRQIETIATINSTVAPWNIAGHWTYWVQVGGGPLDLTTYGYWLNVHLKQADGVTAPPRVYGIKLLP